jgi:hypothetical protein
MMIGKKCMNVQRIRMLDTRICMQDVLPQILLPGHFTHPYTMNLVRRYPPASVMPSPCAFGPDY